MTKVGRNDRCLCGSGKKYKKCCLPVEQHNARVAMHAAQQQALTSTARDRHVHVPEDMGDLPPGVDAHALDELSNGVLALIRASRLDEALIGCKRLLDDYPGVPDGLEMSAKAHDALGNHALAADFWQRLVDFAELPSRRHSYADRLIAQWKRSRDGARQRARSSAEAQPARAADPERAP